MKVDGGLGLTPDIDAIVANAKAQEAAKQPEFTFTEPEREAAVKKAPELTKPVSVNFASGSAELTKRAQQTIDTEIVPLMDNMGGAYFSVEGNTDATGSSALVRANTPAMAARPSSTTTTIHRRDRRGSAATGARTYPQFGYCRKFTLKK